MEKKKWIDVWLENYRGDSEAGKEIKNWAKSNYKGHTYIPWATMVKLLYQQDDDAQLTVVRTADGSIVHTSSGTLEYYEHELKGEKELNKRTTSDHRANFVVVNCVFMGKSFEEVYPIQDNSYNAPNYYDSNMVNKSLQRAKAKVISTATGLGFKLYEDGDLQFDDPAPKVVKQNIVENKTEVVKPVKEEVSEAKEESKYSESVIKTVELIHASGDKIVPILQKINPDIIKTYGFALATSDKFDELADKISKLNAPAMFYKTLVKRLNDSAGGRGA